MRLCLLSLLRPSYSGCAASHSFSSCQLGPIRLFPSSLISAESAFKRMTVRSSSHSASFNAAATAASLSSFKQFIYSLSVVPKVHSLNVMVESSELNAHRVLMSVFVVESIKCLKPPDDVALKSRLLSRCGQTGLPFGVMHVTPACPGACAPTRDTKHQTISDDQ